MLFTKILTILLLAGPPEAPVPTPSPVACAPVEQKSVKIRYPAGLFDPAALKKLPENLKWKFKLDKVELVQVPVDGDLEVVDASSGVDRGEVLVFLQWYAEHVYSENEP